MRVRQQYYVGSIRGGSAIQITPITHGIQTPLQVNWGRSHSHRAAGTTPIGTFHSHSEDTCCSPAWRWISECFGGNPTCNGYSETIALKLTKKTQHQNSGSDMAFPLQDVTVPELKELCQAIWDWNLCGSCQQDIEGRASPSRRCLGADDCPWVQRSERLGLFFDFYREVTGSYVPDFFGEEDQALRGHRDLFDIIRFTRRCGFTIPRELCVREHFTSRLGDVNRQSMVPESDQGRAFDLAARVLTMTNLDGGDSQNFLVDQMREGDEGGIGSPAPAVWVSTKCLQDTLTEIFPPRIHPSLQAGDPQAAVIKKNLTAEMLKGVARIRIERTDNLQDHLRLDSTAGVVQVFHQTSVLREHLLATKTRGGDET